MDSFKYRGRMLFAEGVSAARIAKETGTPTFVYSAATLRDHFRKLHAAFAPFERLVCYSVKANANLAVLRLLREEGAGFDVVSGGELYRALRAGAAPETVVFAGVGKNDAEIAAALKAGILAFNVESKAELENINRLAGRVKVRGGKAPVALRVNPDVDPKTHAYIATGKKETKFGLDFKRAAELLKNARKYRRVEFIGLHAHIGSQITEVGPYRESLVKVVRFLKAHRSPAAPLHTLNIGGGFGIHYEDKKAPPPKAFAEALRPTVEESGCRRLLLEPGRFISGNAGILLTRVLYVKEAGRKRFVIVDAAMNDLLRPCLYGAFHEIWPVACDYPAPVHDGGKIPRRETVVCDVVGPICESGDFLAKERRLPKTIKRGDLLAVFSAGAYGHTMSSNYNARPSAPEVLTTGRSFALVRRRQTPADLTALEEPPAVKAPRTEASEKAAGRKQRTTKRAKS